MITTDVSAVAAAIVAGDVVAIPTDTVYGLACDPRNAEAVARIYEIKRRPASLELGILAADRDSIHSVVRIPATAAAITERYWPGPLSLIVDAQPVGLAVPRQGRTLSVRIPDHVLLRRLLSLSGPVASTSANRHGDPPAASASAAASALGDDVRLVLEGGPAAGRASTIIDWTTAPPRVLREGPIALADIGPLLGG